MKLMKLKQMGYGILCLATLALMAGCASKPKLGNPTDLQKALNLLPEVEVAGKKVKFEFGGDVWISKVNGAYFLAGTFTAEDTPEGSAITLKQTHAYSNEKKPVGGGIVGWVGTPGPDIVLDYIKGPPEELKAR